ncbi:MAG: metal ABC transporter permease, partial [Chlamydiae bacterium]|nr:metal ABC transporter permease [Chlamydiota bacterium]
KKISAISGSIAHSILGGIGLFLWLGYKYHLEWLHPIYGAFLAAIISSWLIGWAHLKFQQREDALIATIWSVGMAIGVIFLSLTPAYNAEFINFLFGNMLWTTKTDLLLLGSLDLVVILSTLIFYKKFLTICFDEEQALLQKIYVKSNYFFLLSLISISIVLLMQSIGIILVIAFLTIPATIASLFSSKLSTMMIFAILLSILFTILGMFFSYELNTPPGATIAILTGTAYVLILPFKR